MMNYIRRGGMNYELIFLAEESMVLMKNLISHQIWLGSNSLQKSSVK